MKKIGILCLAALLMAFAACAAGGASSRSEASSASAQPQKITAEQAYERIGSGDDLLILDVRTPEEYETSHIPGAVLLPNEEIGETRPELLPDPDREILIYCRSGNRSAQAARKLAALGYTKLYDFGGINDWPYDTESGAWKENA